MPQNLRNVFISHIHEDDHRLEPLTDMLAKNGCQVRDSSVNSSNPNNAKSADYIMSSILQPRIDWAGTMIVLISPDTRSSQWVNREIDYAHRQGKRIVGVWDHGEKGCELSESLDEYADAVVAWRSDQIIDAINNKINDWRAPNGEPLPERAIARYRC